MAGIWNKLIVALDLEDKRKIKDLIKELSPYGVKFKIGSIAFTKLGPNLVKSLIKKRVDIFLDLKLYDIPNTMIKTAAIITQMGCWAFTVHIKAGAPALGKLKSRVAAEAKKFKLRKPLILGVTELTSIKTSWQKILKLVEIADSVGLDGVIASAWEAKRIKRNYKLKVVTPGIRGPKDNRGDQKRVACAKEAFRLGADYIVVGRPIIESKDYLKAAKQILFGG